MYEKDRELLEKVAAARRKLWQLIVAQATPEVLKLVYLYDGMGLTASLVSGERLRGPTFNITNGRRALGRNLKEVAAIEQ